MGKKVTIQDIADALGVSRNTVSKAINNADGLAEVTREKILQKAVEMGYKQFSYVQSLYRSAETARPEPKGEIALLTTFYFGGSHFAGTMLDGLQRELGQLGYRINIHMVQPEDIQKKTLPFTFLPEEVSAAVCVEMFDWAYDKMLCELGLPILFVDSPVRFNGRALPADHLYMDNTTELSRLLNAALKKGLRRIGFLGDYMHCQSFFERYMAFRTVMLLADVPVDERFIIRGNNTLELFQELENLTEMPDLFVCANDFVAYDALRILRKLGRSVPEDVMLCGFDNAPESRMVVPAITTFHIHTQIMAYSAAQLLVSRIQEPSLDYRRIYTETELVLRESTGDLRVEEAST